MFLLDENLSWRVAHGLAAAGYQVTTVVASGLASASDAVVFAYAQESGLTLITRDHDFLGHFAPPHPGIVVLDCPAGADNSFILRCLLAELPPLLARDLRDSVWRVACP